MGRRGGGRAGSLNHAYRPCSLRLTFFPDSPESPADETLLRVAYGVRSSGRPRPGWSWRSAARRWLFAEAWPSDCISDRGAAGRFRWVRFGGRLFAWAVFDEDDLRAAGYRACGEFLALAHAQRFEQTLAMAARASARNPLSIRNPVDPRLLYASSGRCVNAETAALFATSLEKGLRRILAAVLAAFLLAASAEFFLPVFLLDRGVNAAAAADFAVLLEKGLRRILAAALATSARVISVLFLGMRSSPLFCSPCVSN